MTCIVGIADGKQVWVGGDSAGVDGLAITLRADEKVFVRGEYVIGFTSSFRMGQVLRYMMELPDHPEGMNHMEFMVCHFVECARKALKTAGVVTITDSQESCGTFIVGYRGQIYRIGSDFQVGHSRDGFDACGCGDEFALGAIAATGAKCTGGSVLLALKVAQRFSCNVRGPFVVRGIVK